MSEKSDATMELAENPEAKSLNPNDTEVRPGNENNKSYLKYFLELLSDSVVTGVPQIVTVGNLVRKIFKILVLGACIGGFIYQAVEFMKLYKTYPSSLEIEVKYKEELPHPAVTLCNINPLKKTQFCEANKEHCAKPKNLSHFCRLYPHQCNENTTVDDLEFVISDIYIDDEVNEKFGQTAEDLIDECCYTMFAFGDQCRKKAKKVLYDNENNVEQNCYVVNFSEIENWSEDMNIVSFNEFSKEGRKRCLPWNSFAAEQTYSIMINLNPGEMIRPDMKPSAQAVVHSSIDMKNPFLKGFTIEEGKRYTVTIKAFEEHLLPAPYSTNCTDNEELSEDYNRENCNFACALKLSMLKCGCALAFFPVPDYIPKCNDSYTIVCMSHMKSIEEHCFGECPRPCHSSYFEYEVSISNFENRLRGIDLGDGPISINDSSLSEEEKLLVDSSQFSVKGKAVLKVVYSKKEVTSFTYKPKYEKIEILGYIGGFSGIWLGVSLVAVFDFFETIFVFFWFLANKWKVKKNYGNK